MVQVIPLAWLYLIQAPFVSDLQVWTWLLGQLPQQIFKVALPLI